MPSRCRPGHDRQSHPTFAHACCLLDVHSFQLRRLSVSSLQGHVAGGCPATELVLAAHSPPGVLHAQRRATLRHGTLQQERRSGPPLPSPGDLLTPGTEAHVFWVSCTAGFFTCRAIREACDELESRLLRTSRQLSSEFRGCVLFAVAPSSPNRLYKVLSKYLWIGLQACKCTWMEAQGTQLQNCPGRLTPWRAPRGTCPPHCLPPPKPVPPQSPSFAQSLHKLFPGHLEATVVFFSLNSGDNCSSVFQSLGLINPTFRFFH